MAEELIKRTQVYIQQPHDFEMSGCPKCGNVFSEWSEYRGHLWCQACKIDFVPQHAGVIEGPVGIHTCEMMGIYFDMFCLADETLRPDPLGTFHYELKDGKLTCIAPKPLVEYISGRISGCHQ